MLADYNQASPNPVTATCNATVTSGCVNLLLNNQARPLKTFPTMEEMLPPAASPTTACKPDSSIAPRTASTC